MNIALIIAGGSGTRTGQDVPKQFLTVYDIPIIAYTMKNIEKIPCIDEIYVVGPQGWENFITSYAKQCNVTKFKQVIHGGATRHESIYHGILQLAKHNENNPYIVITDANRPLIPQAIFENCIHSAKECDCSIALEPCYDSMYISDDGHRVNNIAERNVLYKGQTPECADLNQLLAIYQQAQTDGITDLPASALFLKYGKKVVATKGSPKSFKITTIEDIELFKAMLNFETSKS